MKFRKRHRRSPHIWYHLLPTLLLWLMTNPSIQLVNGQCFGGVETYEKTSGTTVMCEASECNVRGLVTQEDTSVTRDCIAICKQSSACTTFTVDYANSRCQSYDLDANSRSGRKRLEKDSIVNFFEKVCLRGVRQNQFDKLCNTERGWAFERVINGALDGYDHKSKDGVESRNECARLCLLEDDFECRSAEYDSESKVCILSREDRRTQPEAFRNDVFGVDYIENQCAKPLPDCSYTSARQDVTVVAMDDILFSRSSNDCKRFCDDARAFNCRSYAQKGDRCYLSGDDSVTLQGVPQPVDIGAVYKEKACTRSTCDGGIFTYEKTTGHFLRTAREEPLVLDNRAPGITVDCAEACSSIGADCPSFSVDYGGQRCFKMDRNTQGRGDTLAPRDGTNYFEKVCLRGEISGCQDKAWAFERMPGFQLVGHNTKELTNIPSRRDCEEFCLRERGFPCRSAEYNSVTLDCVLSRETRRSRPGSYREARNWDYLENGCISTSDQDCPYQRTDNAYPRYLDTIVNNVKDEVACEVQCTYFEQFVCRSFAFYASANQCFISGDDRASASKDGALQNRPGTDYYDRNCNPLFSPSFDLDESGNNLSFSRIGNRPLLAQERRCNTGKLHFEKTTGYELIRGNPSRLFSDRDGGIIKDCAGRCESDARCMGFNMDYNRNECQAVTTSSENNLFNLRPSSGMSYFEGICLKGRSCNALWTFERMVDKELRSNVRDTIREVTKTDCEDLCLSENRFDCRSASYDHLTKECHLSADDRFTHPDAFVTKQGTDYLENQCQAKQTICEYAPQLRDQYLIYTEKVTDAFSDVLCEAACNQEREFICRSYTFRSESRPGTPQCLLSGDTSQSAGKNAFQIQSGALFSEKLCDGLNPRRDIPQRLPQSTAIDNDIRPLTDGFDLGIINRQTDVNDVRDLDTSANDGEPGNCDALGLQDTFEKVIDFTYDRGTKEEIKLQTDIGLITSCLEICARDATKCLAVTLQNERGGRQACYSHDSSATTDGSEPTASTGVFYFEKICVRKTCRKSWTFTRVPRMEFIGEANEEINNVRSIGECRNLCLASTVYQCRSATYDSNAKICRLTEETRRSAPSDFRPAERGVDYIENECADIPANCEYLDQPGTYLPFTDTYLSRVNDIEECRSRCTIQNKYNCRSFNYNAFRKECFLSSDDSTTLQDGLHSDRDFIFSERGGCNSGAGEPPGIKVRVECTPSDMLVSLSLANDFRGRIYATGNPQACFELGNGQNDMTLRIPLGTECGTVQQNRGRYVNHVVIQENPVIMQDTDKTVRVECAFTAEDQTVSFRPTGPAGDGRDDSGGGISVTVPFQPTGTNIVTNTAPTPGVRMRVVRSNGETANMVGLGEDLQLRIEIDQESAFGLFARKLEARTDNGELMNLVDDSGCPVNELIFPALQLEETSRALYTDFKAFRFPSTPIVNFIATVQFCQDICEPMQCTGGLESYGKRRKRALVGPEMTIQLTTPMSPEADFKVAEAAEAAVAGEASNVDAATKDSSSSESPAHKVKRETHGAGRRTGRVLPEHVDLGLRLTVGEMALKKPFLESSRNFPEMSAQTEASPDSAYFPSLAGFPATGGVLGDPRGGDPDGLICSPHGTLVASICTVVAMNILLIVAFVVFYRYQRRKWMKKGAFINPLANGIRPVSSRVHPATVQAPPPLPSRPSTASGALGPSPPVYNNSAISTEVLYKDPYQASAHVSRQRFSGLSASSMTSLPRS